MMVISILFTMFNVVLILLYLYFKPSHIKPTNQSEKHFRDIPFLSPLSLEIISMLIIICRQQGWLIYFFQHLQRKLKAVYGQQELDNRLVQWLGYLLAIGILILEIGFLFAIVARDSLFLLFTLCILILYFGLSYKQLEKLKQERERLILRELPEWLSKLVLLVQTGETIQQAFMRSIKGHEQDEHPLYKELKVSIQQIKNRVPFSEVLEQLSLRCQLNEMTKLTATLLLYHQRGGTDFSLVLKGFADELWEKRKAIVKQQGEEAASKLVFPLVIIFIGILLIIAWPALQMLSH